MQFHPLAAFFIVASLGSGSFGAESSLQAMIENLVGDHQSASIQSIPSEREAGPTLIDTTTIVQADSSVSLGPVHMDSALSALSAGFEFVTIPDETDDDDEIVTETVKMAVKASAAETVSKTDVTGPPDPSTITETINATVSETCTATDSEAPFTETIVVSSVKYEYETETKVEILVETITEERNVTQTVERTVTQTVVETTTAVANEVFVTVTERITETVPIQSETTTIAEQGLVSTIVNTVTITEAGQPITTTVFTIAALARVARPTSTAATGLKEQYVRVYGREYRKETRRMNGQLARRRVNRPKKDNASSSSSSEKESRNGLTEKTQSNK